MKKFLIAAVLFAIAFAAVAQEDFVAYAYVDQYAGTLNWTYMSQSRVATWQQPYFAPYYGESQSYAPSRRRAVQPASCQMRSGLLLDCDADHFAESSIPETACVSAGQKKTAMFPCISTPGMCVASFTVYKDITGTYMISAADAARNSKGQVIYGHGTCAR